MPSSPETDLTNGLNRAAIRTSQSGALRVVTRCACGPSSARSTPATSHSFMKRPEAMKRSPAIPAGANDELTYEERRELAGAPLPDDGIVTIVPDQIDASLAAGCPVAYGQEVMPSYDGYDGSGIYTTGVGEKSQGSHEQLIVGAGPGYYLVLNSWGAAWGRGGFAMIDRSFFWGPNAWELFSVRKAPVVRYP